MGLLGTGRGSSRFGVADYRASATRRCDAPTRRQISIRCGPGQDRPEFTETVAGVQHLAPSVSAESFDRIKAKLDAAGIGYLGPDRGVEGSMYLRDPNGMGLESYREALGVFEGAPLLKT
jgi:glyoxylase I family protein